MTEWHVEYRIEVEAETPEDAAQTVADILSMGGAQRGAYHVREHVIGGPGRERAEVVIDLDPAYWGEDEPSQVGTEGEQE